MRSSNSATQLSDKDIEEGLKREKSLQRRKSLEVDATPLVGELREVDPSIIWDIKVAMFDTRVDDAQALLRDHFQHNIWAMSLYCESAVVEFSIGEKKPADEEAVMSRVQVGIAQANGLLKLTNKQKNEKRLEALSMEAHALLCYGFFLVQSKSYVRSAYYLRKSWKKWDAANIMCKELVKSGALVSERIQAFISFGLGFFYFGISMVPPEMEFITKVLGFKGNRPLACELLERTAKAPECGKSIEASLILYLVKFWLMDERDGAVETLRALKESLPKSPLILLMHGWQSMIKDHNTDVSIECYKTAYELAQVPQLKLACLQQLSWAYYLREEWPLVVQTVESYIEKNRESGSYSAFSMAVALYMLDRREECTHNMKQSLLFAERHNNWDSWAVNSAQSYLEQNDFDRCHLLFILAENSNDAGFADRSLKYLDEIDALPSWRGYSADDKKALHAYFKGCALRIQKKFDEAKSWLIRAAGYHSKQLALGSSRAVPYALVVLGEMHMRDMSPPNLESAARFFAKAKSYDKKFLFQQLLQFRLKSDLEVLDCKKQKEAAGDKLEEITM